MAGLSLSSALSLSMSPRGGGGGGAPPYVFTNAEAEAFVARFSAEPNDTYKAAYDTLFGRLKVGAINGSNILSAFDVMYVRAAPSQQAALLNLMGTSFTSTLSTNAPTFHAGYGFTTNGIDSYVEWGGWRPSDGVQFAQNSACIGGWSRRPDALTAAPATATDSGPIMGTTTNSVYVLPRINSGGGFAFRINSGTSTNLGANSNGSGFYCAVRPSSTEQLAYKNGVQFGTTATVTSAARAASAIREGNGNNGTTTSAFTQNQLPFSFAGRALTANEVADLHAAFQEYLTAIGWLPLFVPGANEAAIRASATVLPSYTSRVDLPDAVPTIVAGKGFTCTGAAQDTDGTWWVSAFGYNVQGSVAGTAQPYIVHLDTDRATVLGVIDLAALGIPVSASVGRVQGLAIDTVTNTIFVAVSGVVYNIAKSTTSPALIGSWVSASINGLTYDSTRDKLVRLTATGGMSYINKDGTTTGLPSLGVTVPGSFGDQLCYMPDLDAFLVTGGPNSADGILARVGMNDQNYGAMRTSESLLATGHTAIEGIHRDPATKVATIFNDWWYHGSGGAFANGSALTLMPF